LPEEERQQIKDLLFILEKCNRTRPYDSTTQSAVSAFDLNSFIFLDLLFSVISENSFPLFVVPTFLRRKTKN
jgi:hypothetical protein